MSPPPNVPELRRWRADTPSCERRTHLNNAGAALMPRPVRQAVDAYLDLEDELGGYEATEASAEAIHASGDALARLLNASRIFSSTTSSLASLGICCRAA